MKTSQTNNKHMFEKHVDKQERMFYTCYYETQEDLSDHTNGAGNTSESDKPSLYIHTNSKAERLEFETQNALEIIIHYLHFISSVSLCFPLVIVGSLNVL